MRAADYLPTAFNAAEFFVGRNVAEGRGDALAIVGDERTLTYGQLDRAVRGFASALLARGLHAGDRVVLILADGPAWSIGFWGTLAAGCVAVPLNPGLRAEEHAEIIGDCGAQLILNDPETILRDAEQPAGAYATTHRDGFAFFLYSSGTTGEPKGVVHLHHDMWICARTYGEKLLRTAPSDRTFSVAKLFFAYGLGNAQYFPMDVGASSVLFGGRPTPEAVFEQVARHKPTLFFAVPTAYAQMLAAIEDGAKPDFSSVRMCVSAGEALPASIFNRWLAHTGLEICDGIGSTEITHIFLSNTPGGCVPGSSGKPVPGYDVRIVDEDGTELGTDEIGELIVRGDSTMALYWNKHERTKSTLVGDWIRTGDKYRRDADGVFWHAGRSDDMLKVSGMWVSPVEVESALTAHEAVLECAVIGRQDRDGLTKPHAYVVLRSPSEARASLESELQAFVKEQLAPHKYPRWVTVVDALPKTATGKTQRFVLRGRSLDSEPTALRSG
ncbi:MAG: benzoate-CoA ligase family protein [Candidatus Eremiobacteraeota bacterium]|nr:benzoate-CoA ligase family protein [Candidatus Eremiobacteraeota bacterium]